MFAHLPRNSREGGFVAEDTKTKNMSLNTRQQREHRQDLLTTTVRGIVQQEKAAQDAKTAKLRALRLARESEEPAKVEPAPKRSRKTAKTDPVS
jgi:hypothetical protein